MKAIAVQISQVVGDGEFPPFVECLLIDAMGQIHRFVEKEPVVSLIEMGVESLPAPGVIACDGASRT